MPEALQHVIVTLVAAGSACVVFLRVFTTLRPTGGASKCNGCPSARAHGKLPAQQPDGTPETKPLTLVRH